MNDNDITLYNVHCLSFAYNYNLKTIPRSYSLTLSYFFRCPHVFTFTVNNSEKFQNYKYIIILF